MIDAKRAGFDPRIIASMLFAGALVLLGFTIAMNYSFAASIALSDYGKLLRAGSSIGMDVFGAVMMLAAGFAWTAGHRTLAFGTFLAALGFMAYTGWNLVGFGATERLGAEYHRNQVDTAQKAHDKANMTMRTDQAKWLRETSTEVKGEQRTKMIAESNAQIDKALSAPVQVDKVLPPDAQASMVAEMTGAKAGSVQRIDIIVFAALLIMGKSIGFGLAPVFWPRKAAADTVAKITTLRDRSTPNARLGNELTAQPDDKRRRAVESFLAEVVSTSPGSNVVADDLHCAYAEWARRNGSMTMTQSAFGRVMTETSVQRQRLSNGSRNVYLNIRIKPMELKEVAKVPATTKKVA